MTESTHANRACLMSLGQDLLAVAFENPDGVPDDHPLVVERSALTGPCQERHEFYMAGAAEATALVYRRIAEERRRADELAAEKDLQGEPLRDAVVQAMQAETPTPELLAKYRAPRWQQDAASSFRERRNAVLGLAIAGAVGGLLLLGAVQAVLTIAGRFN